MPRGQAELVTTFEVDANGLLKVTAQDRASGRKAQISKYPCPLIPRPLLKLSTVQASPTPSAAFRLLRLSR